MAKDVSYQTLMLCNLIATSAYIKFKFAKASVLEHPLHLAVCILVLSGSLWYALSRWSPSKLRLGKSDLDSLRSQWEFKGENRPYQHRSHWWQGLHFQYRNLGTYKASFALLAAAIVLRVLLSRSIIRDVQCSWDGVNALLPLFLALSELVPSYERLRQPRFLTSLISTRSCTIRYALLLGLWIASELALISLSTQRSTFICPSSGYLLTAIRTSQCLELLLDTGIIIAVSKLSTNFHNPINLWKSLAQSAFLSAAVLGVLERLFFWEFVHRTSWSIRVDYQVIGDFFFASLLCTNFLGTLVYLMRALRPATLITTISCLSALLHHFVLLKHAIPEQSLFLTISLLAFIPVLGLAQIEREASRAQQYMSLNQSSSRFLTGVYVLLITATTLFGAKVILSSDPSEWKFHPIDGLVSEAQSMSDHWLEQASASRSLGEAVEAYQWRYGIPPPPHFDKWYAFAISRGSVIVDDFGQIHEDLLPFWGMRPRAIRQMTGHMLERPWTEVAGLRISNGTARFGTHVRDDHRWMMEGIIELIKSFVEWLPDMDLAFNTNDENRVAIPYEEMQKLKDGATFARRELHTTQNLKSFSIDTLRLWQGGFMQPDPIFPSNVQSEYFSEGSKIPAFVEYGSVPCPPDSHALTSTWWNKKSLCHDCASPHSLGPFLANWTLSTSVCHQPDMAHLHGFYISPSAFKATHNPFPIFSQSKIPSFSDILYPSPWNYVDKVSYNSSSDMPFSDKDNTLFWRGATSEAWSKDGTWKGMQRQRFVKLANQDPKTSITLLLPSQAGYKPHRVPLSSITSTTNVSLGFVDKPARCHDNDCPRQAHEFTFTPPVDFQSQWRYKYLLDLDGAGFSGRFLPFLQSRSLVFRAAAFRQWFDERIVAWAHFVPVDARAHGLWDLVAYFGGLVGGERGEKEGMKIAEAGRERAEKVMRKEDMEVYMFRLLLEWGRIVDDERDEIGYVEP